MTRKITRALARIALGLQDCLYLGNLSALRDWGHARDYIEMQWLMLLQQQPEDFVIATGVQVSVWEFVQRAATKLGITLAFSGNGTEEVGTVVTVTGDKARCKGRRRDRARRRALLPAHRGRDTARRRVEGEAQARLDPRYNTG